MEGGFAFTGLWNERPLNVLVGQHFSVCDILMRVLIV